MEPTYTVMRFYQQGRAPQVIRTGLTLEEAKEHCNDPETSSRTGITNEACDHTAQYGHWFDGFNEE